LLHTKSISLCNHLQSCTILSSFNLSTFTSTLLIHKLVSQWVQWWAQFRSILNTVCWEGELCSSITFVKIWHLHYLHQLLAVYLHITSSTLVTRQGCQTWPYIGANWTKKRQIWDFLKKSHNCPQLWPSLISLS